MLTTLGSAWIRMKQRLTAPVVAGIVIATLFLILAVVGVAGSSNRACATCHSEWAGAQLHTAHESTSCSACHGPGLAGRIGLAVSVVGRMLPAKLVGGRVSGPVTETSAPACLACHNAVMNGVSSGSTGLKIDHAKCAPGATCDTCHSTVAHGALTRWKREPIMQDCTACHAKSGAPVTCTTCHVGRTTSERLALGPWQVTHGPNWETTHGMGELDSCATCHPADYCSRCHKVPVPHPSNFGSQHGVFAMQDRQSCLTCHQTQAFCDACHGIPMPHPTGFLKVHSSVAKSVDNPLCQRCHAKSTCELCHIAHVHPGFDAVHKGSTATTSGGQP